MSRFTTHSPAEKIAVRYTHQRYEEESEGDTLSPRDYGTQMHRVMENASSREDMEHRITHLVVDGLLTQEEAVALRARIDKAFEDKRVSEWFDGSWEAIHREREIIHNGHSWRPDRVMIRGEEAVIIDYKFGLGATATHQRQVERYADLLRQMGYSKVSGYLWYITMERIEKVV